VRYLYVVLRDFLLDRLRRLGCRGIMKQFSHSCSLHEVSKLAALAQALITLDSVNSLDQLE
jgi:hypothetical protein